MRKKIIKKAVVKRIKVNKPNKPKIKKISSSSTKNVIKIAKKKGVKKTVKKSLVKNKPVTKKKKVIAKAKRKITKKKVIKKNIINKEDKIVLFDNINDDINIVTVKSNEQQNIIKQDIIKEVNQLENKIKIDQEGFKKQLNVKINNLNTRSPHLVDLKERKIVTYIDDKKNEDNRPKTLEDKLASFEEKFHKSKTNFITPEAIKHAKKNRYKKSGKIKRIFLVLKGNASNFFEKHISKIGAWSDDLVTNYLVQKTNKKIAPKIIEQTVESTPVKQAKINNKIKNQHHKSFSLIRPVKWIFSGELRISLSLFLILAIILILPLKAYTFYEKIKNEKSQVLGVSTTVYQDFSNGVDALAQLNFFEANNNFNSASDDLISVREVLDEYPAFLISAAKNIPKFGDSISTGDILIDVGNNLAQAGVLMSQLFTNILTKDDKLTTDKLVELKDGFSKLSGIFTNTNKLLVKINKDNIPENYWHKVSLLKQWLPLSGGIINNMIKILDVSIVLLGHEQPQKYLIVFQNSNELRPTGGFIGSFAEVNIDKGQIKNVIIPSGGIYDLQGNLKVLLAAPKPLQMLNANWQIQDSNWWFDFPTSAKKILWFYEKSGGPTVDGLIAINSNILSQLISITGPIYLQDYDLTLDRSNIIDEIQKEVEFNFDEKDNQPKKIISELVPIMIEKLQQLSTNQFMEIFTTFNKALVAKDIQIYHQNNAIQKKLKDLAWTGDVKYAKQDYLAVVNTNIGGGKADNKIRQQTYLQTIISEDGTVRNKLKIRYDYTAKLGDLFIKPEYKDYLRVYVPLGSRIINTDGFYLPTDSEFNSPRTGYEADEYLHQVEKSPIVEENTNTRITEEFGKTVFGNWVKLIPGETNEVYIEYELPFKVIFKNTQEKNVVVKYFDKLIQYFGISLPEEKQVTTYTAMWQKQSGQVAPFITHEVDYPSVWDVTSSPSLQNKIVRQGNKIYYQSELNQDIFWGVILSK